MKAIALAGVLVFSVAAVAAEAGSHIAGTYSSLYYNKEAGDLLGMEMFIVPDGDRGYKALVEVDEGELGPLAFVPVEVRGTHISFRLPEPSLGAGAYEGKITRAGFRGTWTLQYTDKTTGKKPIILKRKHSYWDN